MKFDYNFELCARKIGLTTIICHMVGKVLMCVFTWTYVYVFIHFFSLLLMMRVNEWETEQYLPAKFGRCGWNMPAFARNSNDRCGGTKPGLMGNCNEINRTTQIKNKCQQKIIVHMDGINALAHGIACTYNASSSIANKTIYANYYKHVFIWGCWTSYPMRIRVWNRDRWQGERGNRKYVGMHMACAHTRPKYTNQFAN